MSAATQERKSKKQAREPAQRTPREGVVGKMFYLDEHLAEAFDAYINSHKFPPSQTAVFEAALKMLLASEGFWPLRK